MYDTLEKCFVRELICRALLIISNTKFCFLKTASFGETPAIKCVRSISSMSQKGLGQAWDKPGTMMGQGQQSDIHFNTELY